MTRFATLLTAAALAATPALAQDAGVTGDAQAQNPHDVNYPNREKTTATPGDTSRAQDANRINPHNAKAHKRHGKLGAQTQADRDNAESENPHAHSTAQKKDEAAQPDAK